MLSASNRWSRAWRDNQTKAGRLDYDARVSMLYAVLLLVAAVSLGSWAFPQRDVELTAYQQYQSALRGYVELYKPAGAALGLDGHIASSIRPSELASRVQRALADMETAGLAEAQPWTAHVGEGKYHPEFSFDMLRQAAVMLQDVTVQNERDSDIVARAQLIGERFARLPRPDSRWAIIRAQFENPNAGYDERLSLAGFGILASVLLAVVGIVLCLSAFVWYIRALSLRERDGLSRA